MQTYISVLRGINVSGHRVIKMDALKKSYAELGFTNILTYIQSGNVIFQFKKSDHLKIENVIKNKISDEYGFDVPVIVKDAIDLKNVVKNNSFLNNKNVDFSKLHVTFLSAIPAKSEVKRIKEIDFSPEEFIICDDIIYLYCPGGYGNTKLNNNFFENKLKVKATNRNWKTVNELCKIADSIE
ncbi:MAG: DUF1697 domain-containing protein [Candidatus Kapaibacterium sp.]